MFPEAVTRYHDLLAKSDLAENSRATLDQGLERAKLIFGGRRLSPYLRPHFVTETDFARISQILRNSLVRDSESEGRRRQRR